MVLDNATASDSSFSEPEPSTDIDPYSTSPDEASDPSYPNKPGRFAKVSQMSYRDGRKVPEPIYINVNELPQPLRSTLGLGWPLFDGQKLEQKRLTEGILQRCRFAADVLQRPVNQDEANALAFHYAKALRIHSYGFPAGMAAGAAMTWRTRESMGFPFYNPFKEGSRFSQDSFFWLKGSRARYCWHWVRFGAYGFVSLIISDIFFGSYALSTSLAGCALDPRLKEFTQAQQQRQKNGMGRERGDGIGKVGNQEAGPKGSESYEMARQRVQAQNTMRRSRQGGAVGDDASPTSGAFSEEYMNQDEQPGFLSEQEVRQQVDSRSGWTDDSHASKQSDVASRRQTYDDASPQASSKPSGSAWERLRSQAMAGQPDNPRKQSRGLAPPDA